MHQRKTGEKVICWETAVELSHMFECPVAALTRCHAAGREQPGEHLMAHPHPEQSEILRWRANMPALYNSLTPPPEFVLTLPMQDCNSSKARSKIWPAHAAGLILVTVILYSLMLPPNLSFKGPCQFQVLEMASVVQLISTIPPLSCL